MSDPPIERMKTLIDGESSTDTQFLKASMVNAMSDAQGVQTLEALADHIRQTLPLPCGVQHMELNRKAGLVILALFGQRFVFTPSLEVFELKGTNLLITATSSLFQSVLARQEKNARLVDTLLNSLAKIEDLLNARNFDRACALLASVRHVANRRHR